MFVGRPFQLLRHSLLLVLGPPQPGAGPLLLRFNKILNIFFGNLITKVALDLVEKLVHLLLPSFGIHLTRNKSASEFILRAEIPSADLNSAALIAQHLQSSGALNRI